MDFQPFTLDFLEDTWYHRLVMEISGHTQLCWLLIASTILFVALAYYFDSRRAESIKQAKRLGLNVPFSEGLAPILICGLLSMVLAIATIIWCWKT